MVYGVARRRLDILVSRALLANLVAGDFLAKIRGDSSLILFAFQRTHLSG